MSTGDRKAELERKKARLAEIRAEKKRQQEQRAVASSSDSPGGPTLTDVGNIDEYLAGIGVDLRQQLAAKPPGFAGVSPEKGDVFSHESSPSHTVYKSRGRVNLQKAEVVQVNVAPREQVLYNKTTQTIHESVGDGEATLHFDWDDEFGAGGGGGANIATSPEEVFDLEGGPLPHHLPHIEMIKPAEVIVAEKKEAEEKAPEPPRELSEEEKLQVLGSDDFVKFFGQASRVLERALTEKEDIFIDYARGSEQGEKGDIGARLSLQRSFFDEKWTKGRCVTYIDYCPQHPELVAASYNNNEDLPNEPDGVVLVWNAKFKKTSPEYVFHCQSRVVSVSFAKFHPNLILGGTYSGQICLWDNRLNKKTPVQKTPLSTSAHTHPVFCMKVVGTQHAHNLISISSDGKLCSWSLDMLSQPQDTLELSLKQGKTVAAMCMSFPSNDVNNFLVGSEDGVVYSACRHGSKQGVIESFEGHFAPVTGVASHAAVGAIDFSHLFISSSFDWTVKLWNSKEPQRPLYSFEDHSDYVMDVAWSPVHPALFACVDSTGKIDLWDLNQDTEVPAATAFVEGVPMLNKLMWMPTGQQICVGDGAGAVHLYDVGEALAMPRTDEWSRLNRTLHEIRQMNLENDELAQTIASTISSAPTMSTSPLR